VLYTDINETINNLMPLIILHFIMWLHI